ncbi:MAG: DUF3347 domain-containing protein [Bacteroidia bacterium]|nr:DUF3347 domain-containing protein [Bacteroidia bacterium]
MKNIKSVLGIAIVVAGLCSVASCTSKIQNPNDAVSQMSDSTSMEVEVNQSTGVINAYLGLKYALTESDGHSANVAANDLLNALQEHNDSIVGLIRFDAEHIASTMDIAHQRDHFNSLSNNIYELVHNTMIDYILYRQFCPMALNGKGAYWISAEEEIVNPYFGEKMLHCGRVIDTIPIRNKDNSNAPKY